MNYPDSVQFLYALGNEMRTARLGLDRIRILLTALGDPHRKLDFVHVAGTNGKGSACAMIESALRAARRKTGLFTSPHLVEPTERIRIQGIPVTPAVFAEAFDRVHIAAQSLLSSGAIDVHPSYFETVTAMAFLLFVDAGVEIAVMEVGLGGRLDATNVIMPRLSVITPIDYDHQEWLGHTLESIAREKAGILKPGTPAVISEQHPDAARVLEPHRPAVHTAEWQVDFMVLQAGGSRFGIHRGERRLSIACPLAGEHQVENALTAAAALIELGLDNSAIEAGIAQTVWPGRLEFVRRNPDVVLDGAHNPAGTRALAAYIRRFYSGRRIILIYGAMGDKSVAEMSATLFPLADRIIITQPDNPRAMSPEKIRAVTDHRNVELAPNVSDALAQAAPRAGEAVFVAGSLYLVGQVRALLVKPAVY
jgi:dihydrofolate synthase / folylpolyglutamate synthase